MHTCGGADVDAADDDDDVDVGASAAGVPKCAPVVVIKSGRRLALNDDHESQRFQSVVFSAAVGDDEDFRRREHTLREHTLLTCVRVISHVLEWDSNKAGKVEPAAAKYSLR